ncbi:MAG: hypothetical protein AB1486_24500 [Planctomycetota bacterium]
MMHKIAFAIVTSIVGLTGASAVEPRVDRPNRVLLVIGDQWHDANSYLIGAEYPSRFKEDLSPETDLLQLVTLFKSWGIPFDIVRLDQEILNLYHFIGPDDKPRYGAIVWAADQEGRLAPQDYRALRAAVESYGISLIALSNRIKEATIQELLGVEYAGYQMTADDTQVVTEHFISRGLPTHLDDTDTPRSFKYRVRASGAGTNVIAVQGAQPQITVRELSPAASATRGASAIWIGGDHQRMLEYQNLRTLLKRALVWAVGFALVKEWERCVIAEMDDPGGAQCAWLDHWHYPTLKEEEIRKHLIEPLREHGAVIAINVVPGFVDDGERRVVPAWAQRFSDAFGVEQDFASTKRGLEEGLREGVFEIQSHGWTHMQPDLESPPGPWWGAPADGEKAEIGWYREFYDIRRRCEIAPAEQTFRMKTSVRWIEHQFGVSPLSLICGGGANSKEYANDTFVLAARAGFGSVEWCYAGKDLVLRRSLFHNTPDVPAMTSTPPDGHDRGITMDPAGFLALFHDWSGYRFMGWNEYIAYTHAAVEGEAGAQLLIKIDYDPHYCRFFERKSSNWILHTADWLRAGHSAGEVTIKIDGETKARTSLPEVLPIAVPAGTGRHTVEIG